MNLEVISPYFDQALRCKPLRDLIERFEPRETLVHLPRGPAGEALVAKGIFEDIRSLPEAGWGELPKDFRSYGKAADSGERFVHAKVYRFFSRIPKREYIFLGSPNLTNAAFSEGGNLESGVLVQVEPARQPDFWMRPIERTPVEFKPAKPDEASKPDASGFIQIRFDWESEQGEAYWDSDDLCPSLQFRVAGVEMGEVPALPARIWQQLPVAVCRGLAERLKESSLIEVVFPGAVLVRVLVQERNMAVKPSLLMSLTSSEILEYWALLSPDQRAAFVADRLSGVVPSGSEIEIEQVAKSLAKTETFFDRFAGIFHAFSCLEREVRAGLEAANPSVAEYRLFGEKYDSLGTLLDRLESDPRVTDDIERYVVLLCCRQLVQVIGKEFPEYWNERSQQVARLSGRIAANDAFRERLIERSPREMGDFLDWFDGQFLKRAQPRAVSDD